MTERTVTINLSLNDQIGGRLLEIKKQRDALLTKSKISLNIDPSGFEQARRASVAASAAHASAMKDLSALGGALTSKAVAPLAQYQQMLSSTLQAGKSIGPGIVSALGRVSVEFQRQRTLAAFWGTSGYMHNGVSQLKSSLSGFLSGSGTGFTSWLQNASSSLVQYRTALTVAAAAMVGMAAAAALSSKHSQNYIKSTMDSRLMSRKLPDKAGAEKWVESAQGQDWSAGRDSRMGVFQTVLSKNKAIGQKQAQKATEDIEKYFFANQEMLQKKGISSAEALASSISAPELSGEDAAKFEDIFGLGFSRLSSTARLSRLGTEAKDIDINKAVGARPDEVLSKRVTATTQAMGDAVLPALNAVLGGFIKLSDIIGKIPGLGKAMGWGAVLLGGASAGLVMVSMVGSLIPGLITVMGIMSKLGVVTKLTAAAQWLLNVAMSANPLGITIIAIAGLIAVLYVLEKRFGLVTKAWKLFSESTIGKGVFASIANGKKDIEDLLGTLGKAYKSGGVGGVLKVALEGIVANSPLFKMVAFIFDILRKLWVNSGVLNKLFATGLALWNKMTDFFSWLLNTIKGGLQWIRDGLGVTRSETKAKMEKIAEKEGLSYKADGKSGAGWYDKGGIRQEPSAQLAKAMEDYNKSPKGFFEGIPGIDELRQSIDALKESLREKAAAALQPTMSAVNTAAANALGDTSANPQGEPVATSSTGSKAFFSPTKGQFDYQIVDPGTGIMTHFTASGADFNKYFGTDAPEWKAPKMARGGPILGTESIIGHGGEEMDPARVVQGGKTTLERINEMFSRGVAQGRQPISISAPVSVSVSVDKLSSDIDIDRLAARIGSEGADKLLFALRNKLENGNTRGIGYLRG